MKYHKSYIIIDIILRQKLRQIMSFYTRLMFIFMYDGMVRSGSSYLLKTWRKMSITLTVIHLLVHHPNSLLLLIFLQLCLQTQLLVFIMFQIFTKFLLTIFKWMALSYILNIFPPKHKTAHCALHASILALHFNMGFQLV